MGEMMSELTMSSNDILDADFFETPDDRRYVFAKITAGRVRFQNLNEGEMSEYRAWLMDLAGDISRDKLVQAQRKLITLTAVNMSGKLILSERHIKLMEAKDGKIVSQLAAVVQQHVGIDTKDIEMLVGNSSEIGGIESHTDSQLQPVAKT